MEPTNQNPAAIMFVASTVNGWTVVSENGIKLSGNYKSLEQAKDAVKNLMPDQQVQIVLKAA